MASEVGCCPELISTESVVLLGLGGDVSIGVGTKVLLKLILVRD